LLINALQEAGHHISFCTKGSTQINHKDGGALRKALGLQLKGCYCDVWDNYHSKKNSQQSMTACFSTYPSVFDHTKLSGPAEILSEQVRADKYLPKIYTV